MAKKMENNSDKPRGRPRLYDETHMRSLRFPLNEWQEWDAYAKANKLSVTGMIVDAMRAYMKRATRKGKGR
jgi:hypothetical protein